MKNCYDFILQMRNQLNHHKHRLDPGWWGSKNFSLCRSLIHAVGIVVDIDIEIGDPGDSEMVSQ